VSFRTQMPLCVSFHSALAGAHTATCVCSRPRLTWRSCAEWSVEHLHGAVKEAEMSAQASPFDARPPSGK
jgi:hypothetical protein